VTDQDTGNSNIRQT